MIHKYIPWMFSEDIEMEHLRERDHTDIKLTEGKLFLSLKSEISLYGSFSLKMLLFLDKLIQ